MSDLETSGNSSNAAQRLVTLARQVRGSDEIDSELSQWLAEGVDRWVQEGESLDDALGLKSPRCSPSPRLIMLRELRDQHIRAAHRLVDGTSSWQRSEALARTVRRFASDAWPRLRHRAAPDRAWSQLKQHLWAAFAAGVEVPSSAKQLDRINRTRGAVAMSDAAVETPVIPS